MNQFTSPSSTQTARGLVSAFTRARRKRYIDALMDDYVSWREACGAVAVAYEGWKAARGQDRDLAFRVYHAALDREEHAATAYQTAIAQVSGRLRVSPAA